MSINSHWDSKLYDNKLSFISKLGKDVVALLDPQPGERILDLGCGTGDLTNQLLLAGADPVGLDFSSSMIERAKSKYPSITFRVDNAETFRTSETFAAVFSNAALHWMTRPSMVIESVWLALEKRGRFVAEFGGIGNVATINNAISKVAAQYGSISFRRNKWYFPSIGEYASLLEAQGFRVVNAQLFDRPTQLEDGENGLRHWLDMFGGTFFTDLSDVQKSEAYSKIEEILRPTLFSNGKWTADYVRIRVKALKL